MPKRLISSAVLAARSGPAAFILCCCMLLLVRVAIAAPQGTAYFAATWNDSSIHFLDTNMSNLGSFPTGATLPNGVAASSSLVYVGHFQAQSVRAFDYNGVLQFSWTSPRLDHCQGLELVNGQLATVYHDGQIDFLNPATGAYIRSIPNDDGPTVEGLAYDGTYLWTLGDTITALDPLTGAEIRTIVNPALGSPDGGTGLANAGPGQLMVAAENGAWWRISSTNGAILASGNNGLNTFGLAESIVPEPGTLLALPMSATLLAMRRRTRCTPCARRT